MGENLRLCIDRTLSPDLVLEAARLAIEENPSNTPAAPRFSPGLGVASVPSPLALAALTGKKWKTGRIVKVHFLDGDPEIHNRIKRFAKLWEPHANIRFEFRDDPDAEVRVSFQPGAGSWSHLGIDALVIPDGDATMNYGWLTHDTHDEEYERVVCHEFGHALGCFHEHQHPEAGIPWNKEAVYAYFAGPPNFWTKEQVDHNLFRRYSRNFSQFSKFDPESIMLYAIPDEFTIGDFEIGWNRTISRTDQEFIGVMYPSEEPTLVEISMGQQPINASIGRHGEEDVFRFNVDTSGSYIVETIGDTDVVMTLSGPESETSLIDQDDDTGLDLNARIQQRLEPGTYFVRVRHYRPSGTGDYQIAVRRAL